MRRNNLNDFGVLQSDRLKMSRLLSLNKKQNFRQLFYLKLMVFREDELVYFAKANLTVKEGNFLGVNPCFVYWF